MTKPHKIVELYAWIVTQPDGEDTVPAIRGPHNTVVPLVGSDRARMESLRSAAKECVGMGLPVRLCKFSTMEVLEWL